MDRKAEVPSSKPAAPGRNLPQHAWFVLVLCCLLMVLSRCTATRKGSEVVRQHLAPSRPLGTCTHRSSKHWVPCFPAWV